MISTGMLMIPAMTSTPMGLAPGNATSVKKIDQASVDPIGAEMTALKIVASRAEAVRTSPVLLRTNSRLVDPVVAMDPSRAGFFVKAAGKRSLTRRPTAA